MIDLTVLTSDEIQYICEVIPHQVKIDYFTHHPKEFQRIYPGFRAKSVSEADATRLFVSNACTNSRIAHFVESVVDRWMSEIRESQNNEIASGKSSLPALVTTLPQSYFSRNPELYFKLSGEEFQSGEIEIISAAISAVMDAKSESDAETQERDATISSQKAELNSAIQTLNRSENKNEKLRALINTQMDNYDEKALAQKVRYDKMVDELEEKIETSEATLMELRKELEATRANHARLEERIRDEYERAIKERAIKEDEEQMPLRPVDISLFEEYLNYNFENIGVQEWIRSLLIQHLSKILFNGKPIIINKATWSMLAKCIANTITGEQRIKKAVFPESETLNNVLVSGRIVCLDNYIGNSNETELLPIVEKHRNRIIFLTVAYERSLHYVSDEFLCYCNYLNINRIAAFSAVKTLNEDSSTIDEAEYESSSGSIDQRSALILREILNDLEYPCPMVEQLCAEVSSSDDLDRILLFSVLPYSKDVRCVNPYNASARLQKHVTDDRRGSLRGIYEDWFS
jgi:hypothetical protein